MTTPTMQKNTHKRPPLGLIRRRFVDENRIADIKDAIARFTAVNRPVPIRWVEEYNEIAARLAQNGDALY